MAGRVKLPAGLPLHVLREYAVLADGERAALVGPRGEIAWLCAPQWHDDPVFGSLIGGPGTYAVTPLDERYVWGGYYEEGTPRLARPVDRRRLRHGVPPGPRLPRRQGPRRAAPPPRGAAGRRPVRRGALARRRLRRPSRWSTCTARAACGPPRAGRHVMRWTGAGDAHWVGSDNRLELVVELRRGPEPRPRPRGRPRPPARAPTGAGRDVVGDAELVGRRGAELRADHRAHRRPAVVRRPARPHERAAGGMVAAATMSLPERGRAGPQLRLPLRLDPRPVLRRPGGRRVRAHPLLDDAVAFVSGAPARARQRPAPGLHRRRRAGPGRSGSSTCPATPAATDVVGNWVNEQFQLDAFGEALLLFAAADAPRPARPRRLAGRRDRASTSSEALEEAGRRHLGARRPPLDALAG